MFVLPKAKVLISLQAEVLTLSEVKLVELLLVRNYLKYRCQAKLGSSCPNRRPTIGTLLALQEFHQRGKGACQ